LLEKKFVIALNKSDLGILKAKKEFSKRKQEIIETCALNGKGCADLAKTLGELVYANEKKEWR